MARFGAVGFDADTEAAVKSLPGKEKAFELAAVSPIRLVHFKKSLRLVFISFGY
jgi:hypothetical protein